MEDKEFNQLMKTDMSNKAGCIKILEALGENEKMSDEQFEKILKKIDF